MKCPTVTFCCIIAHIYWTLIAAVPSPQSNQILRNGTKAVDVDIVDTRQLSSANAISQHFSTSGRSLEEARMTTVEIIRNRGYAVEVYKVTTEDGYILELHRIPYGKGQSSDPSVKRQPVYLQHGFLNTDNVWLINPVDKALAYILVDTGLYDVWLGNIRGNTYSRAHASLDISEDAYWDFSFDEMGYYDIPAVINFVLNKTGRKTISYVGHSMGCAVFYVCMSLRPEFNAKIDIMIALAPATSMAKAQTSIRYQARFINQLVAFYRIFGIRVYEPVDSPSNNFRKTFCGPNLILRNSICRNSIFSTTGDNYRGIDVDILPVIDGHNPAGTSVRTAAHFAQNFNAGQTFQRYDFGPSENLLRYGQQTPPAYELSKVTSAVYIFWGESDKAVAPADVAWLASKLGNLKSSTRIEDPEWNHVNFLFSTDAKRLVYDKFIPLLPKAT
ncbi:gastric triacylglycerol lipase-like [Daphnia carinata]|uniref:gastric triacylglycerol lipase-like n=1 Tax=Daphnia carinata TaxID=120202 RepID=UPI00257E040A|nr:gastric triacylglycerol lipase-like [Daphnia carinata]